MKTKWVFLLVVLGFLVSAPVLAEQVRFKKIIVDKTFRSEGAAVGEHP